MKIITVVGARPQFIKAATLSRVLRKQDRVNELLLHTGQHFDANMSAVFFDELDIPNPDFNLEINGGGHGEMTGKMLSGIEQVLLEEKPNWVLIYGDTNSTLAGALAAVKLHIPIAHVEAGLRSFNRKMPEEINRVLTDHASDLLFAPTRLAMENLKKEGLSPDKIEYVGDVMFDAAKFYGAKASSQLSEIREKNGFDHGDYALVTIHRAENTDEPQLLRAIANQIIKLNIDLPVIWPLHPRTRHKLIELNLMDSLNRNISIVDPVGYLDMVALEKGAKLIVTDSGGVQKEAFFHRVPCLTLRNETEWVELVDGGYNILVNPLLDAAPDIAKEMIKRKLDWDQPLYGTGNSAELICQALLR